MLNKMIIKNKIILVTGGAQGIGFQIARHFLKEEAMLAVIVDIEEDLGKKSTDKLNSEFGENRAVFIKCDVTQNVQDVLDKIDKDYGLDVLVNSAAIVSEDDPKLTLEVNVTATALASQKFIKLKGTNNGGNGGTIINLSSIFGYRVIPVCPIYHAAKFGIIGYTKSLGHEVNYKNSGVRVIAICPGFTDTNLVNKSSPEFVKLMKETYIWQQPETVAEEIVNIFQHAESGTVWEIEGGVVTEIEFENRPKTK